MLYVLGDYAGTIAAEILTTSSHKRGAEFANLKGLRMVVAAETDEGARLSPSALKQITSTDKIHAERKYFAPEDFVPSHTTILYTNHPPRVGSTDNGTWRRIVPLPFTATISGKKDIKNFASILAMEAGPAILQWCIEGAVKFCSNGYRLIKPDFVTDALADYRAANDWLADFLMDVCEIGPGKTIGGQQLYQAYRTWASLNTPYVRHKGDFVAELERRGYVRKISNKGTEWHGLDLQPRHYPSFGRTYA